MFPLFSSWWFLGFRWLVGSHVSEGALGHRLLLVSFHLSSFLVLLSFLFCFLFFWIFLLVGYALSWGVGFHLFFFWTGGYGGFMSFRGRLGFFFVSYSSYYFVFLVFLVLLFFFLICCALLFPFYLIFTWFVLGVVCVCVCGFSCVILGVGGFWWFWGFRGLLGFFLFCLSSFFFSIFLFLFVLILVSLFLVGFGWVKKERQVKKRGNKDERRRTKEKKPKGPLTDMRPRKPP